MKVLAYIRYSSHNQDEGNSVAAQTTTIENYVSSHGMEIENYYIDMAKTGRNINRPQYQQMIADIKHGTVEAKIIIVRAIDRLHRNAKNQLSDMEWFAENGIRLISIVDGIDTNTETSKLLTTIKAAVAEDFSETLSKNTRAGLLECAKQCRHLGGTPPIGYKVNAQGFYEIDELKAPIIREIYKLYLQGMGYSYIIKNLKENGYKTSEGNDFSKASLNAILKNPKYMGTYVYDRSTPKNSEGKRNSYTSKSEYIQIKQGMPAIISAEDFEKV
ncbi:recombinase family protein, partial [Methanobrevibacter sp.]|uniref:recombinase family protein n=1 Tax=Methanobrevibacter sp. TaxID=66852 RepID=UPI00388D8742